MDWATWVYFNRSWRGDPRLPCLLKQHTARKITLEAYTAGVERIKHDVLERMLSEGRITESDLANPSTPWKKVRIGKAARAHGKAHKLPQWKYSSESPGGLPGLGKR
jgi:hypothetical protein